jgi:hypothetical protein
MMRDLQGRGIGAAEKHDLGSLFARQRRLFSGMQGEMQPSAPNPKFAHIVLQERLRTSGSKGH